MAARRSSPGGAATASIEQLEDAAVQLRLMESWAADKARATAGATVLHAVDMDVIYMYASPMSANPKEPPSGRLAYGQVFRTDPVEVADALTARLADFIFFKLSGEAPLLVVPPIQDELGQFLMHRMERFGEDPPPQHFDIQRLGEIVGDMEALKATNDALEEIQRALVEALRLIYLDTGPEGEFRRAVRLLDRDRIASPDAESLRSRLDRRITDILDAPTTRLSVMWEHIQLRDEWMKRLDRPDSPKGSSAVEADASALARIELWNASLAPYDVRIVYITGARSLLEAGWGYEMIDPTDGTPSTFTDLYLRHPRAFVDEEGVMDSDQPLDGKIREVLETAVGEREQGVLGLLRTHLTSFENPMLDPQRPFRLSRAVRGTANKIFEDQPSLEDDLKQKWLAYCQAMRPTYRAPPDVYALLSEAIAGYPGGRSQIRHWNQLQEHFLDRVQEARDETYDACYKLVARTGLSLTLVNPRSSRAARSMPPIIFDRWPVSTAFIETVSRWHTPKQFDAREYAQGTKNIEMEDESGYAYYLVHAALFGGHGKWQTAAMLSERALRHAQINRASGGKANGREAAYMLAVCKRHSATNATELVGLEHLIELAQSIHADEMVERPAMEVVSERFEGEKAALEATRWLFARFGPGRPSNAKLPELQKSEKARIVKTLHGLDARLRKRLTEAEQQLSAKEPASAPRERKIVSTIRRLDIRVTTNLLSLMMIDGNVQELRQNLVFREASGRLSRYRSDERREAPEISFLVSGVADCAAALLEPERSRRSRIAKLREALNDEELRRHELFPYDFARMTHLRELASS